MSRQPDPAAIAVLASQLRLDEKRLLEAMERRGMACEHVSMALAGVVQPRLVTALLAAGAAAVGLTGVDGALLRARPRRAQRTLVDGRQVVVRGDHSGRITAVNVALLTCLLDVGFGPPPHRTGGIGVKLLAARDALAAGVPAVLIAGGDGPRPVRRALSGSGTGVALDASTAATPVVP